ncbi:MAG: type IV pilus secretin PilQ [Thermodesulfobacteriota bacterium]
MKSAIRIGRNLFILGLILLFAGCASLSSEKAPAEEKAVAQRTITDIGVTGDAQAEKIVIQANERLNYTSVKQKSPMGVIFYFPDTAIGDIKTDYAPESEFISAVSLAPSEDEKNARLEIDLNADTEYDVVRKGNAIEVKVQNPDAANPGADTQTEEKKTTALQKPAGAPSEEDSPAGAGRLSTGDRKAGNADREGENTGPAVINQIDFSAKKSGDSAIIVGTTAPVDYEMEKIATRRLQLKLFDVRLPEYRQQRPLITTRFDSAVDRVTPVQSPEREKGVDVVIELREQVPYRTEKTDGRLIVHFDASSIGPRPFEMANLPPWQKVLEESVGEPVDVSEKAGTPKAGTPVEEDAAIQSLYESYFGEQKEYTGEKIALDFYETDIKNVFRILQQVSGKNYAIDPNVSGTVSISMEKPVPWDQVLDLILQMNNLGMEEKGDIIRIATKQTLQQEEQARQERVQDYKKRQEQQKALEPLVTKYIPINYANAQSEILPHVKDVLTKDRGQVSVDERNNQLIITDVREKIEKAKEIISQIDKVTPQVVIEARIVEVSDDFSRELGTEWQVQSEDVFRDDLNGEYSYDVAMNHPAASNSSIGFDFVRLPNMGTPMVLNAKLTAMEENGEGKIISTPKIVTIDNKKASITQGFEYPYQTVEDDDVNVEFKDIDLTLEVTPHVTPDQRIAMQIYVTKNDVDSITESGEPALSTNEAETELLVDDGSTIVIGGIMKKTVNKTEFGFPVLKDIPLLGWLFKSKSNTNQKNELLIFMTPRVVQLEQRDMANAGD